MESSRNAESSVEQPDPAPGPECSGASAPWQGWSPPQPLVGLRSTWWTTECGPTRTGGSGYR
eukprot:14241433-Alexandrium_andersonii.AAC.1